MESQLIKCPLTGSSNVSLVQAITVDQLLKLYWKYHKIDISFEISDSNDLGLYYCEDSDLRFFYPLISGSEEFYKTLQENEWYYVQDKEEYHHAKGFIQKDCSILEVGCGTGSFTRHVNLERYTGLELNHSAIKVAQHHGIHVLDEKIQSHSIKNFEKYDVVCAFQVLEHVADLKSFIDSCVACLKPNGLLIYAVPSYDSFVSIAPNNPLNMPPHHVTWWSDRSLYNISGIFNLDVVDLMHDNLSKQHQRWYAYTLLLESFYALTGYSMNQLVDLSIWHRIISRTSSLAASVVERAFANPRFAVRGHSVTAIYRKK